MLNSKINKQDYQNFINNINYGYSLISKKNFEEIDKKGKHFLEFSLPKIFCIYKFRIVD